VKVLIDRLGDVKRCICLLCHMVAVCCTGEIRTQSLTSADLRARKSHVHVTENNDFDLETICLLVSNTF
jgi:hypothetical protein